MTRAVLFALALASGAFLLPASGADTVPPRIHGIVKSFDGQYLTIKADSGHTYVVGVQPQTRIVHSRSMTIADIKPGDFIGTLSLKGADGKLRAQAVRLFSDAMHGAGEGQYPQDSNPARTITNASVTAVAVTPGGGTLTLSFHGAGAPGDPACSGHAAANGTGCVGTAEISIARGVPVLAIASGDISILLPGAIVSAFATADPVQLLSATSITVERDGKPLPVVTLTPPAVTPPPAVAQ